MHKPVILMDFGGVYFTGAIKPVTKRFSRKFGIPQQRIHDALAGANWKTYAEGRCNDRQYWKNVSDTLELSREQTQELRTAYYDYPKPQKGMIKFVRKLKGKYRIAVISSHVPGWIALLEKKYRMSREFHELHYSYNHGIDKPHEIERLGAKFFMSTAKKMKVNPKDCIVIDDKKKILDPIKRTGARTILFKNAKQLEADLKKMGVEI